MAEKQATDRSVTHNYKGGNYRAALTLETRMKPKLRVWRVGTNGKEAGELIAAHLDAYELDELASILRLVADEVSS